MKAHIRSTWHPKYTLCELPHNKYIMPADDSMELCKKCEVNARSAIAKTMRSADKLIRELRVLYP